MVPHGDIAGTVGCPVGWPSSARTRTRRTPRIIPAMPWPSTSGTPTSRSGCCATGSRRDPSGRHAPAGDRRRDRGAARWPAPPRRRLVRRRRRDRLRLGRAGPHRPHRGDRGPPRAAADARLRAPCRPPSGPSDRARWGRTGSSTRWRPAGCRTPAVVVDFGTATTFDCVATDGAYVGGDRAGLELGLEALAARTAKLPRIDLRAPDRAIGRDTVSAMQSGTVFGYQSLVTGLLTRIRRELADASGSRRTT